MNNYVCTQCQYTFEGDEKPEKCVRCNNLDLYLLPETEPDPIPPTITAPDPGPGDDCDHTEDVAPTDSRETPDEPDVVADAKSKPKQTKRHK